MITLVIIIFIYVISGWSYRYHMSKIDKNYPFNPFDKPPTLSSFNLVGCTIIMILILVFLILRFLP